MSYETQFLKRFEGNEQRLRGLRLLVEVLPEREIKTASGLILSAPKTHVATADSYKPVIAVVLMCGSGYVGEDGKLVEASIKPGQVVVVNEFGMRYFSQFPRIPEYTQNKIAITSESEVFMDFPSLAAFEEFETLG
jgi:co-chaperonin GroES (HSP10)